MKTAEKNARGKKAATARKSATVQESSGNVFADLGVRNPQETLAKAQLAHQICQVIVARRLTQTKAAAMMALDQPKISALMRGKLHGFSAERLFRCLNDLGQEVEITISTSPTGRPARRHSRCRSRRSEIPRKGTRSRAGPQGKLTSGAKRRRLLGMPL